MKKSILFLLWFAGEHEFTYAQVSELLGIRPVSARGAVMALRDQTYVNVFARDGKTRITITATGRELLKASFLGFKDPLPRRERVWSICLIVAGQSDERPLRTYLKQYGFFSLERGMYVLPYAVGSDFSSHLHRLGAMSRVLVFESKNLLVGDETYILRERFEIKKISNLRLHLERSMNTIGIKPASKQQIKMLIPKLMAYFAHNLSLLDYYFPQEIRLSQTKTQITLIFSQSLPQIYPQ